MEIYQRRAKTTMKQKKKREKLKYLSMEGRPSYNSKFKISQKTHKRGRLCWLNLQHCLCQVTFLQVTTSIMKRTVTGSSESGDGQKKARGDSQEFGSSSFEEDLMMMEEMEQENLADEEAQQLMDMDGEEAHLMDSDLVNTRRWQRPTHVVDPQTENLAFQWLDIDMTSGDPWRTPQGEIFGSTEGPVPVIRLYGVTAEKSSVMLSVHGFTPYMYVSLPTGLDLSEQCLAAIRATLDIKIKERARGDEKRLTKCILGTERVRAKQSLLGYHFETTRDFLKVYVALPSLIPQTKRAFDDGFAVAGFGIISGQCYEANVPYILRCVHACLLWSLSFSFPPSLSVSCCVVLWCGVVWCGVVWCGVVWCGYYLLPE